jgi:succinyl-diaminopimelate desuccinylase
VVPTGPDDRWQYPAFDPTIKHGMLYCRGAEDKKGNLADMVTACDVLLPHIPITQAPSVF